MGGPRIKVEGKRTPRHPLRVAGLALLSVVSAGIERARRRTVERLYEQGETERSLLAIIEDSHVPGHVKELMMEHVVDVDRTSTAIEVESTVEDAQE